MSSRGALDALRITDPVAYERIIQQQRKYAFVAHSPGQKAILDHPARFKVVRAGRRYGKTKLAARAIIRHALRNPGTVDWWVGNVYKNTRRGYREVLRQLPPQFLKKPAPPPTANDLILELTNGSRIEFYSGTNPDSMAGEGVGYVVVDEAALQSEVVWTQIIRPTLMDHGGGALLISTPRGRNWFYDLHKRGLSKSSKWADYATFHRTTFDNPLIARAEIEEAKESLPERIYQQEILAEFITDGGLIFGFTEEVVVSELYVPSGPVVMGVDLAKHEDFTVITASNVSDRLPVYYDKFNQIRWPDQRQLIKDAEQSLRAQGAEQVTIMVDSGGVGDVIFDDLEDDGLDVVGIKFTNQWKNKAVKLLAADLQRGAARLYEPMVPEFEQYEYTITPSGNFVYGAPEGLHDDDVSAKILEHWGQVHEVLTEGVRTLDATPQKEPTGPMGEPAEQEVEEIAPRSTDDLLSDPSVWSR